MSKNYFNITIALAGVCQSAQIIQYILHQNKYDDQNLKVLFQSILNINPKSIKEIYGGTLKSLHVGLNSLQAIFNSYSRKIFTSELTRYTLEILLLSRILKKNYETCNILRSRICEFYKNFNEFDILSNSFIFYMNKIYLEVISPLGFRIKIVGKQILLKDKEIQARIRTILLAGIRFGILWQQVGGTRLQLIFNRNKLCSNAKYIIKNF